MALPEPKGKESWIHLAQLRIARVLQRRITATTRQLEVKICESGPPKKRPQPHILDTAIERMVKGDQLIPIAPPRLQGDEQETTFFTLPQYFPEPATQRMRQLLVYYRLFRTWAETQEYCGDALEKVVENTFTAAGAQYRHLGRLPLDPPDVGTLDGVWELNGQRIGVEAKNWRAWIYPSSPAIWKMIRKCLVIAAVPFLVAREVAYITGVLCSRMGMLAFETHRQIFDPLLPAHLLADVQHTDQLGYKDVLTWDPNRPHPHLLTFLTTTLPRVLPGAAVEWTANRQLLTQFARDRRLGIGNLGKIERDKIYREFSHIVFPRPEPQGDVPEDDLMDGWNC